MPLDRPGDPKAVLHRYLDAARDAMLWKLDGLDEYDVRRPLTPTGTNLLGLVKHLAGLELGYLGMAFGRPADIPMPWLDDGAEPNADMWATPDESRAAILDLYARARAHADATIDALVLDAPGRVPWWPDDVNPVTLEWILVHLIAETNRHVGQADVLREGLDGSVGLRDGNDNLPDVDAAWWTAYVEQLESAARAASEAGGSGN
jgi:uncharacterized damage-inducible protein DinB